MEQFRQRAALQITPVIKYLIIINALFFLGSLFIYKMRPELSMIPDFMKEFPVKSDNFRFWQPLTHMFMHATPGHIFFNMFGLWMLGKPLEQLWGGKKFLLFYLVSGLGASVVHTIVTFIQYKIAEGNLSLEQVQMVIDQGSELYLQGKTWQDEAMAKFHAARDVPSLGASGAVFGIFMAFGMTYPESRLMLLFPPIPIKGKYFAIFALVAGVLTDFQGNVAHFAHLGGMIFGFLLIRYWKYKQKQKLKPFEQTYRGPYK